MVDEKKYARNPDFIYRKIVDESVLVPFHNNVADMDCIYTLNSLGAFIWEQLAEPATRVQLEQAVLTEYNADPDIVVADLDRFLAEMVSIGAMRQV